jgi:inosine-uridine nucleoside N-ribohydrolase
MGELSDDDQEQPADAWKALVSLGESHPGTGLEALSKRLKGAGPFPPSLRGTPLIVDTDIGGDPDDALALVAAARHVPELALVVTTDEVGGERARFARHLLNSLGRGDVSVVSGAQLGEDPSTCIDGLTPRSVSAQPDDVLGAVSRVCDSTETTVRWVGMGPPSNLWAVLKAEPRLAGRLRVTQMGGALRYRDPGRAEHNFRLDPRAAAELLRTARKPWLVTSDVTFRLEMELTALSAVYRRLSAPDAPPWAAIITAHMDRWFERHYSGTRQHDALTLTAALQLPFVSFDLDRVSVDELGRLRLDPDGSPAFLSRSADYEAFMRWLNVWLDPATTPVAV